MSRQPFAFSSEDDERSLSPLSLTDRGEQQQVNEPAALTSHGLVSNNPPREIVRFPCKARGLPSTHNVRSAYIDIPPDATHGTILTCSHAECASSGRRFRFCAVCHFPVARRNFADRHSHGIFERPPRFDPQDLIRNPNKQRDPIIAMVDAMQDITAKRRAAELLLEDLKVQERLIYMRWGKNPPVDGDDDDDNNNNETNMGDKNGNQHAEYIIEHTLVPLAGDQLHPKRAEPPNLYVNENHRDQLHPQRAEPNHYMASNGEQLYQSVQPNLYMAGNDGDQHAEPNHWNSSAFSRYQQQDILDEPDSTLRKRHKGADTIFRV